MWILWTFFFTYFYWTFVYIAFIWVHVCVLCMSVCVLTNVQVCVLQAWIWRTKVAPCSILMQSPMSFPFLGSLAGQLPHTIPCLCLLTWWDCRWANAPIWILVSSGDLTPIMFVQQTLYPLTSSQPNPGSSYWSAPLSSVVAFGMGFWCSCVVVDV